VVASFFDICDDWWYKYIRFLEKNMLDGPTQGVLFEELVSVYEEHGEEAFREHFKRGSRGEEPSPELIALVQRHIKDNHAGLAGCVSILFVCVIGMLFVFGWLMKNTTVLQYFK